MKILGLITEYNPFHNGHLYHLNMSKKITNATHTVAIMSGNFVQRGEPAIVHKWKRAQMAVEAGVDLVIELPTIYACSTAEFFAYGAISLLNSLNTIDCICFGSEVGNLNLLKKVANLLVYNPPQFQEMLKSYINMGSTFPIARSKAIKRYFKEVENYKSNELVEINNIMKNPNNILGIEYLKAIKQLNSNIIPYTISRRFANYHNKKIFNSTIASATAIRENIFNNKTFSNIEHVVPSSTANILLSSIEDGISPIHSKDFEKSILTILRRSKLDDLKNIFDVVEGLENRIYQCSIKRDNLSDLYNCIKSKRYTSTRLQRILMHLLLNINKDDILYCNDSGGAQYARILAFNEKGREILKVLKSTSSIPVISNLKYYHPQNKTARNMLNIDIRATNIYCLAFKNKSNIKSPLDFTTNPFYE